MLEIASLTLSISKLRHYTNFSDRPPLSQYPGSAPGGVSPCWRIDLEVRKVIVWTPYWGT